MAQNTAITFQFIDANGVCTNDQFTIKGAKP